MNSKLASAKNFVARHKVAIAASAVGITIIALQHKGIQSLNEFLKENDLYEKYYTPEA